MKITVEGNYPQDFPLNPSQYPSFIKNMELGIRMKLGLRPHDTVEILVQEDYLTTAKKIMVQENGK